MTGFTYRYYCPKCELYFTDTVNMMTDPPFLIDHDVCCPKCGSSYGSSGIIKV